jgi:aminoglycoside/choline kinase family phosphotransferase
MGVEYLSASSLTTALAPMLGGAKVVAATYEPVGTGQMSESLRVLLTYSEPCDLPHTMIAKFESASEFSRAASQATRTYEVETAFYQFLRDRVDVNAPQCFHVQYDHDADSFFLLLEDFAPCRQGDQITGCTPHEAEVAVRQLAGLHGPVWNDTSLLKMAWLNRHTPERRIETHALFAQLYPMFVDRYRDRLFAETQEIGEQFVTKSERYFTFILPHFTATHGDFRLDNLLFMEQNNSLQVGVVDFQTAAVGCGPSDLSYFIGSALPPEQRREHENHLVHEYVTALRTYNVVTSFDDIWDLYCRYTLGGYIMAVIASVLVKQTDRGDEMFLAMANRHAQHALDLDTLSYLTK